MQAIARTAKDLEQRENWLKADPTPGPFPHGERGECIGSVGANLTRLYNARPTWLDLAHKRLDEAVFTPMAGNPI